jgi:hypothetical protein
MSWLVRALRFLLSLLASYFFLFFVLRAVGIDAVFLYAYSSN